MEQASPILPNNAIVHCCNRSRKLKEAKYGHKENTDIHNPMKKMEASGGVSIYHHRHHKKQKKTTRVVSKKNKIMGGDELPVDSIYNILSRMPIKSLARFQCISKVWCNYINDPYLEIIMHAKGAAMKGDPTMLMMFQLDLYPYSSASLTMLITKQEEEEKSGATSHKEVVITKKKNPPTPYMEFGSKNWGSRFYLDKDIILGSCKGLIFSSQDNNADDGTTVLLVFNPLKKECYKLPPIKIWSCTSTFQERESCGLGYDDSTNTYKMVCVVLRNQDKIRPYNHDDSDVVKEDLCTMVHDVLGGTANSSSSWRQIPAVPAYPITGEGVFANGCLHWLVSDILKYWPFDALRKVVCFDMMKEEFGLIDPPNTLTDLAREHLVDLDGQVGLVYNELRRTSFIEVWLLNHKTKCWVLHCRFDRKQPLPFNTFIKVIGYWNNKDDDDDDDAVGDLLITDSRRRQLFIYRLKHDVLHEAKFIHEGNAPPRSDIRLYQPTFSWILRRHSINNRG